MYRGCPHEPSPASRFECQPRQIGRLERTTDDQYRNDPADLDFADLELRVMMHMAEPRFVAGDVCAALGMDMRAGTTRWLAGLSPSNILRVTRQTAPVLFPNGSKALSMNLLTESGLYKTGHAVGQARGCEFPGPGHPRGTAQHPQGGRLPPQRRGTAHADDRQAMPQIENQTELTKNDYPSQ